MAVFGRISGVFPRVLAVFAAAAAALAAAPGASAQVPPDYGLSWKEIGDPGNRPASQSEWDFRRFPVYRPIGSVPYTYRLTTTEVTIGQWRDFVQAFVPYTTIRLPGFLSRGIQIDETTQTAVITGDAREPANMNWLYAAFYCNWLHNGKDGSSFQAFLNGAYDLRPWSVGGPLPMRRNPEANFWIPSNDEWTKATYWDPSKNGAGAGGYWKYPGMSDVPLVSGPPEAGGQTNTGPNGGPRAAGSYPGVRSPWGLLDTSGGMSEWSESGFEPLARFFFGSTLLNSGSQSLERWDALEQVSNTSTASSGFIGLRLASVPAPSTVLNVFVLVTLTRFRRRPPCSGSASSACSPSRLSSRATVGQR
ncbi:MAG: SUMF1/EgtB/PvdO family nonheme iron enzyme [Phycisphaerales bacterium]|nr:SUMF1/EgtB/PvdO family nonheme iron enzyme [Phycisphaerales bacterium]